jgi:hypothetical protein
MALVIVSNSKFGYAGKGEISSTRHSGNTKFRHSGMLLAGIQPNISLSASGFRLEDCRNDEIS